jgi:hypothetical protein
MNIYLVRRLANSASINIFSPVDFARSSINSARVSSNLKQSILEQKSLKVNLYSASSRA